MVVFSDVDGGSYSVRGEEGAAYNLLSSAHLSLNTRFVSVPKRFQAASEDDTLLGSVSIAMCTEGQHKGLVLELDASSGHLQIVDGLDEGTKVSGAAVPDEGHRAAVEAATTMGVALEVQRYVCSLRTLNCTWRRLGPSLEQLELPDVDSGHSRLKLAMEPFASESAAWRQGALRRIDSGRAPPVSLNLALTRQALVAPDVDIDCDELSKWPLAAAACAKLAEGTAPPEHREHWALLLSMPGTTQQQRFHFVQLDVPPVVAATPPSAPPAYEKSCSASDVTHSPGKEQTEERRPARGLREEQQRWLHGLLGQRLIIARSPDEVRAANRAASRRVSRGLVEPFFGEDQPLAPDTDVPATHSALNTAHAGQSDVSIPREVAKFGPQGQGAIDGSVRNYVVRSLHEHDFRFSRFNCTLRATPATAAGTPASSVTSAREGLPWSATHEPSNRPGRRRSKTR